MKPSSSLSQLQRLWLCEAISLREQHSGPLEDAEAIRLARNSASSLAERIEQRALHLAARDGLLGAQQHWLQGARLALWLMLILAIVGGSALGFAALGDASGPVNLFWALLGLLGVNWLMLLVWAGFSSSNQPVGLSRLWWWLSEKLARDNAATSLAPALMLTLERNRLSRWLLGALSHGLWLLALFSAAVVMLLLLMTHSYSFIWQSTLLSSETFITLTQYLGALPKLIGFATPDLATIAASGDQALLEAQARHSWASWLLGVLLVFGIIPRAALLVLCWLTYRHGVSQLRLDLEQPHYRLLAERLQPPSEYLGVVDHAPSALHQVQTGHAPSNSSDVLLVGVELDPNQPWPPALATTVQDAGVLDSREQRKQLLERLSRYPAQRLLIAIDPRRSADRGTLALLGELSRCAASTRIWLLPAPAGETLDQQRLADWQHALEQLQLPYQSQKALHWLETGND